MLGNASQWLLILTAFVLGGLISLVFTTYLQRWRQVQLLKKCQISPSTVSSADLQTFSFNEKKPMPAVALMRAPRPVYPQAAMLGSAKPFISAHFIPTTDPEPATLTDHEMKTSYADKAATPLHPPFESLTRWLSRKAQAAASDRDLLIQIRGITPEVQAALYQMGIVSFRQIAEWSSLDVRRISATLRLGNQVYDQNWIVQAQSLYFDKAYQKPQ